MAAAATILVVAFGLRTYVSGLTIDPNLVFGQGGGLGLAQALQSLPDIAWLQTYDVHPPLYQLLLGIWVPLAGLSPFAVKFLGVLASTFGVAATYSLGKVVAGRAVGLAAAFIYAVSVMNLDISASLRPYALSAALAALSLASFVALLRTSHVTRPRESIVAGIWFLSTTAGLFTSLFFAPIAVAQVITVAVLATERRRALWTMGFTSIAMPVLWWVGLVAANALRSGGLDKAAGELSYLPAPAVIYDMARETLTNPFVTPPELVLLAAISAPLLLALALRAVARGRGRPVPVGAWLSLLATSLAAFAWAWAVSPFQENFVGLGRFAGVAIAAYGTGLAVLGYWLAGNARLGAAVVAVVVGLVSLASLPAYLGRPSQNLEVSNPVAVVDFVAERADGDDLVIITDPEQAGYYAWLHGEDGPAWFWPQNRGFQFLRHQELRTAARLKEALAPYTTAWVVSLDGEPELELPVFDWLRTNGFIAGRDHLANTTVEAYGINLPLPETVDPIGVRFGNSIELESVRYSQPGTPGDTVGVELLWRALDQPESSFTVFVHLLDAAGRRVAGHDGRPAAGTAPTDTWTAGGTVRDRHGLLLPNGLTPGSYRMIAGMYDERGRVELESGETEIELGILVIR